MIFRRVSLYASWIVLCSVSRFAYRAGVYAFSVIGRFDDILPGKKVQQREAETSTKEVASRL